MNFFGLFNLPRNKDADKKARDGFKKRQTERQKRFAEKAKSQEPDAEFYDRSYTDCDTK